MQILSALYTKLVGRKIDPVSEILMTHSPISESIQGHIDNGDEVIIIEPFCDSYEPLLKIAGGIPRFIPLRLVRVRSLSVMKKSGKVIVLLFHSVLQCPMEQSAPVIGYWMMSS